MKERRDRDGTIVFLVLVFVAFGLSAETNRLTCEMQVPNLADSVHINARVVSTVLWLDERCEELISDADVAFALSLDAYIASDYQVSLEKARVALELKFYEPLARLQIGRTFFALGEYEKAISELKAASIEKARTERLAQELDRQMKLAMTTLEAEGLAERDEQQRLSTRKQISNLSEIELVPFANVDSLEIEFNNKVVALHFWASWCAPCVVEFAQLLPFYREFKDKGLVLVTLSQDSDYSQVTRFMDRHNISPELPVFYDQGGRLMEKLVEEQALPTTAWFDRTGKLIEVKVGPVDWDSEETRANVQSQLND